MLASLLISPSVQATRHGHPLTEADGLALRQTVEPLEDGLRASVTLSNASGTEVHVQTLSPAVIGALPWLSGGLDGWAVWLNGHWMFSDTLTHRFARGESHPTFGDQLRVETANGVTFSSDGMLMLHEAATGRCLLAGFITSARQFSELVLTTTVDERVFIGLEARCHLEGTPVAAGGTLDSETLVLLEGDDPLALVDRYAEMLAETMRARVPAAVPSGWCSWYQYYRHVTEADILHNVAALRADAWPVDFVLLDDGYEPHQGDWLTPKAKFPDGLAALATQIRTAGYRPALWLAPLVLHRDARILAEHPEFAVRHHNGEIIWNHHPGPWAALDCTHPGARAWLASVIHTLVHEWGYTILKLDALADAYLPGARYHIPGTTSAMNLRAGLEVIREAAGPETFLTGCSCPFYPAVGLVDAMRVSDDIYPAWFRDERPSLKLTDRLSLPRFWMHRRLWLNDPDCLVVRITGSELSEDEVRFLITGVALSGGVVTLSDNISALPPERAALARRAFPPTGEAARPLDLFARETPAVWYLPRPDGALIAFLNWEDAPVDLSADLGKLGLDGPLAAVERWTGEARAVTDGILTERAIPPHAARVVRVTRGAALPEPGGPLLG